jgi:hypothetical protein
MAESVMAKSKRLGRGGRRAGAGRPRLTETGKTSYFSTRITPQIRARLETESRLGGQSLSQTIQHLLLLALDEKRERKRPRPLKALCYLITSLSAYTSNTLLGDRNRIFDDPEYNWRTNPFVFEVFRAAVWHLFDRLRPDGEIVAPPAPPRADSRARYKTPEDCGRGIARSVLQTLNFYGANSPDDIDTTFSEIGSDTSDPEFNRLLARGRQEGYGFADAARDLNVECHWDLETVLELVEDSEQAES